MADEIVSLLRDGATEVWLHGWHIRFPPENGKPTVKRGSSPSARSSPGAEVAVTSFDSTSIVRHGSWIVEVTESNFTVIPTKPEDSGDPHRRYYRI